MGRLDAESMVTVLEEIDLLIKFTLNGKEKDRFEVAAKLSSCGHQLMVLDEPPLPPQIEAVSGIGRGAEGFINALGPAMSIAVETGKSQLRKARADELEALVRVRKSMLESGGAVDDVDSAITGIRMEITGVEVL